MMANWVFAWNHSRGELIFEELIPDVKIDFWASSILVENGGSLIAGSKPGGNGGKPFGSKGGMLTIHLYGAYDGVHGKGITCQSPAGKDSRPGQCGIPNDDWDNGRLKKVKLGNGVTDYFYQYMPLTFDDGDPKGYFGYKVLAVSYGGTLQLFGNKGADYTIPDTGKGPKDSGVSWVRLAGTISPTDTVKSLKVASPANAGRLVDKT